MSRLVMLLTAEYIFVLSARLHLVGVIFRSSDLPCCQKLFHISVSPTSKFMVIFTKLKRFSPSNATDFLICLLKTSGNLWFSDVFRTYRKIPLTCDGLKLLKSPSGSVFCRHKWNSVVKFPLIILTQRIRSKATSSHCYFFTSKIFILDEINMKFLIK